MKQSRVWKATVVVYPQGMNANKLDERRERNFDVVADTFDDVVTKVNSHYVENEKYFNLHEILTVELTMSDIFI